MSEPLDNPVWSSLTGEHALLGRRLPHAARYFADVAPFVGIEVWARWLPVRNWLIWLRLAKSVLFRRTGAGTAAGFGRLAQLEPLRIDRTDGQRFAMRTIRRPTDDRVVQDARRRRSRSDFARLSALLSAANDGDGGVISASTTATNSRRSRASGCVSAPMWKLSAICTDPAYTGRGYAQRLVGQLVADIRETQRVPFLHVSHRNARAKKALYEHLGLPDSA